MSDVQSKRFDTVRVGDEVEVLGSYLTVVAVHGETVAQKGIHHITAAQFPSYIHADNEIRMPAGTYVTVRSKDRAKQFTPTAREVASIRVARQGETIYSGYHVVELAE